MFLASTQSNRKFKMSICFLTVQINHLSNTDCNQISKKDVITNKPVKLHSQLAFMVLETRKSSKGKSNSIRRGVKLTCNSIKLPVILLFSLLSVILFLSLAYHLEWWLMFAVGSYLWLFNFHFRLKAPFPRVWNSFSRKHVKANPRDHKHK